jgi:hypothetical protein
MILYTIAMLTLGSLIGGYLYRLKFRQELKKSLDAMYHKGFESGIEKAQADLNAAIDAYQASELQEESRIAALVDEIGIELKTEEHSCGVGCGHHTVDHEISVPRKTKRRRKTTKKNLKKTKK